ncbi:30S ribosomal protein S3 [Candidatus Parcubacteria bacterium]|jgi:small subunit ribosomal protein S3|nr:30S ribosomal protein S3 [Candidatus Parcubacteria bacterium]
MAQKISPKSYRLGITENWDSRWFDLKNTKKLLEEDYKIRRFVLKQTQAAKIENIEIERKAKDIKVIIKTARPGLLIGRQGIGIETLSVGLKKLLKTNNKINIVVEEVKHPESSASIVAQNIAEDIEKRISYRRVLKQHLSKIIQHKEVLGAKVMASGRLDGIEIARDQWLKEGRLPLTTLRANIDYGFSEAHCTYGVVGIKVWIYKGEYQKETN